MAFFKKKKDDVKVDYCTLPFEKIVILPSGSVHLCCPVWLSKEIGNIFSGQNFAQIWNSPAAQAIRISMIKHSYEFCNHNYCPYLISDIFKPMNNKDASPASPAEIKKTILKKGPQIMTIDYDPTCNLRCKFCRVGPITLDSKRTELLLKFQDNLINSPLFQGLRELIIAGQGEVFASKIYLNIIQSINEKRFPHLRITLLTNGVLLTPEMWRKIANAHYAINQIKISIDAATQETYDKLRVGGNFNTLLKNIKFLADLKKTKELKLIAAYVVQKENYREMPAFVKLMKNYDFDIVYFSKLVDYGTYTQEEFTQAAVHQEDHSEYNAFGEILQDPILKSPGVSLKFKIPDGK